MAFGDSPADEPLRAAWHAFCDRLKDAGDLAFKDANPALPLHRADGFRFLTQNLGQAFPLALETADPAYPQIHYFTHPTMKLGGDVSDFTYRQAWISGDHAYRITGRKGTARWFNLTVQGPRPEQVPGTRFAPLHEPFGDVPEANLFGHQIEADADGHFEIYVGGPQRERNWLPTTPGSRKLFIREAFDAWFETPTHRKVWALAAPMILSNLSVPLVTLVDTAVIGHLPHTQQLGAMVVGGSLYAMLVGVFGILRMSATGFAAQAVGRGDGGALRQVLLQSLVLAALIALLVGLLAIPLSGVALQLMHT